MILGAWSVDRDYPCILVPVLGVHNISPEAVVGDATANPDKIVSVEYSTALCGFREHRHEEALKELSASVDAHVVEPRIGTRQEVNGLAIHNAPADDARNICTGDRPPVLHVMCVLEKG